jgi:hypothetical protein
VCTDSNSVALPKRVKDHGRLSSETPAQYVGKAAPPVYTPSGRWHAHTRPKERAAEAALECVCLGHGTAREADPTSLFLTSSRLGGHAATT